MKYNKIFGKGNSHDYNALSFILVFCSLFITKEKISFFSSLFPTSDVTTIIYKHVNKETCLELSAYQYPALNNTFEKSKGHEENGVFYHYDDENEVIIVQKNLSKELTEISVKFWKLNNEIKIVMLSCPDFIKQNKKVLNTLTDSLH